MLNILNKDKEKIKYIDSETLIETELEVYVEKLEEKNIDENKGFTSFRTIILRFDDDLEMKLNNFIIYDNEEYIIDNRKLQRNTSGAFWSVYCNLYLKEVAKPHSDVPRSYLDAFLKELLKDFKLIEKFSIKSEQELEKLEFPRILYSINKDSLIDTFKYLEDLEEKTLFLNNWSLNLETYSSLDNADYISELLQDEATINQLGMKYVEDNNDVLKVLEFVNIEDVINNDLFINNQKRIRKVISVNFKVGYMRKSKDVVEANKINVIEEVHIARNG